MLSDAVLKSLQPGVWEAVVSGKTKTQQILTHDDPIRWTDVATMKEGQTSKTDMIHFVFHCESEGFSFIRRNGEGNPFTVFLSLN